MSYRSRGIRGSGGGYSQGPSRGSPAGYRGSPERGGRSSPARGASTYRGHGGGPGAGSVVFAEGSPAQIPPHLNPTSQDQLIAAFKSLKVKPERPLRPGFGTAGTPITLRANFFPIRVPKRPIYDYKLEVRPKPGSKDQRLRVFQLLEQHPAFRPYLGYVAHDRRQRLLSAQELPQPLDIQITFTEEGQTTSQPPAKMPETFVISISFDRSLDMGLLNEYTEGHPQYRDYDPLPLISALNIILHQHPEHTGVRVGRSRFFFDKFERPALGPRLEAWKGFYTSVRPAFKSLMVNVNVCMTAFVQPGKLADALAAYNRNTHGGMPELPHALMKSSIKVTTTHLGYKRRYPLKAVATTSARNTYFQCDEFGGRISVENYFKKKYNRSLQHPTDLPVVNVGGKGRDVWIPAELCDVEAGQAFRGRLADDETARMIRVACNPPRINAEAITKEGMPTLGLTPPQNGFGITISAEMATIPGRELRPPNLSYRKGTAKVANGSWNILDVTFQRGAPVDSWWVLVIRDGNILLKGKDDPELQTLVQRFAEKLRRSGMRVADGLPRLLISPALPPVFQDPGRFGALDAIRRVLKDALQVKGSKPNFVLVLLSKRDNYIYPGIKRIGDVELGIQTIHMQLSKALGDPRKQDQYLSNVALKCNTKLGGINHLLDNNATRWLTKNKTMLVGIDVTHPGPTSKGGTPSIAAVVASIDDNFVQFPASIRIQKSRQEMLDELRDMLCERLLTYEKSNKTLPERIFVFRDGVSEGQYDIVLQDELPQMLQAFKKLSTKERKKAYRPQLSIIICGKRHNARFFATNSQFADRNGNTRPGTVVDKGVTGVFDFDFYLQAHAGLQGSVKSTHYIVIYDEFGLGADEIQQGAHDSSYLYARATKAVSLIPPAYYADLACERGRCYLNDFLNDDKASSVGARSSKEDEERKVYEVAKKAWGEGLHPDMRGTMFYI